jgi:hypothetical protein
MLSAAAGLRHSRGPFEQYARQQAATELSFVWHFFRMSLLAGCYEEVLMFPNRALVCNLTHVTSLGHTLTDAGNF